MLKNLYLFIILLILIYLIYSYILTIKNVNNNKILGKFKVINAKYTLKP